MNLQELRRIVRRGEGRHLEFKLKANHPDKIMREAVAFANSEGGQLLIGVSDDQAIKGVKFPDEDVFALENAFNKYCTPKIHYTLEKIPVEREREVLLYSIPKSKKIHYVIQDFKTKRGRAYIRVEDKSVKASREMREILRGQRRERQVRFNYGDKEQKLMQYLELHKQITVQEFAQLAKIPRRKASRTLVLLVLAGVLQIMPNEVADAFLFIEPNPEDIAAKL